MSTFKDQLRGTMRPLSMRQRNAIADYIERLEAGINERQVGREEAAYRRGLEEGAKRPVANVHDDVSVERAALHLLVARLTAPGLPAPSIDWIVWQIRTALRERDIDAVLRVKERGIEL